MDNKHSISMRFQLNQEEYETIKKLEAICCEKQKYTLKLELDFKMNQGLNFVKNKIITEFLYYENNDLVGYLGLCNFSRDIVEVSGMVHPEFRMKGIFKKLYLLAKAEWEKICPSQVLILCDHRSSSGLSFINSLGAEYSSSEYKMYLDRKSIAGSCDNGIKLRIATKEDAGELYRQDSIYFGLTEKEDDDKEIIEPSTRDDGSVSYIAELNGEIIGKIRVDVTDNEGSIYGFGILPDFRRKGYGREVLSMAIDILKGKQLDRIFLEVATENKNALGLYESCGFEQVSVMDYYIVE